MGHVIMIKGSTGEDYINKFPKLKKWINQCACCGVTGYNPSLPDKITMVEGSLEVYYIKKYFKPLPLDQNCLCEQCAKLILR